MECESAREMYVAALLDGRTASDAVTAHVQTCATCAREVRLLGETWAALDALPLMEPSPAVARRLKRRVQWEAARETVASLEAWQRAALAGVAGFALSLVLSLALPYETLVALCRQVLAGGAPTPAAYLVAGFVYGLLPMAMAMGLQGQRGLASGFVGLLEAAAVFLLVATPYVVLACGFPPPLLLGFIAGIALGAVLGGAAGVGVRRRMAWA